MSAIATDANGNSHFLGDINLASGKKFKVNGVDSNPVAPAAVVAPLTPSNLSAIAATYADEAAARASVNTLAGQVETRLDAAEAAINAILTSLKDAGYMASS